MSRRRALSLLESFNFAIEGIVHVLRTHRNMRFHFAAAIVILLAVVSTSYRQVAYAYPSGGGAYAVARANLPIITALVAAGALLVDYVMTVAVSTASAVEQIIPSEVRP